MSNPVNDAIEIYDRVAQKYVEAFFYDLSDKDTLDKFTRHLELAEGSREKVLDVGCGPGQFTRYLSAQKLDAVGIDAAFGMIRLAKDKIPDLPFAQADMRALCFKQHCFSGLLVAYSFVHLPYRDAIQAIYEFNRVLKLGGLLCLMVKEGTGEFFVQASLDPDRMLFVRLWEKKELVSVVSGCGFVIESIDSGIPTNEKEFQYPKLMLYARKTTNLKPRKTS